jgi:ankyrin repeat protein
MIRKVVLASVCFALSGCAAFVQEPGTPLARAAHEGNIDGIRQLIAAGADPNEYDASNQTASRTSARARRPTGPMW